MNYEIVKREDGAVVVKEVTEISCAHKSVAHKGYPTMQYVILTEQEAHCLAMYLGRRFDSYED